MEVSTIRLDGLKALTDETGMFQHTKFSTIDRKEGYTTDDNARALIASLRYHNIYGGSEALELARIYLTFLLHMQRSDGRFHNLLGFDRRFQDEVGSEDCMGHALWACGYTLCSSATEEMQKLAKEIFDLGLPPSRRFTSPRAVALAILGLCHYYRAFPTDPNIKENIELFSRRLENQYRDEAEEDWPWFEAYLTYANARLPQSLFTAYETMNEITYLQVAKTSLDFLIEIQFEKDVFMPIGTNGWYVKRGEKALYDQQPIEASCIVEAAIEAFKSTDDPHYTNVAKIAFEWFLGKNILKIPLYNPNTGNCYDGITSEGLNQNQGAESTLSYYLAYLRLKENNII